MKQHIQFQTTFSDKSYRLFLNKVIEENNRIVVLLECEVNKSGNFWACATQDICFDLVISLKKSTQELPVVYGCSAYVVLETTKLQSPPEQTMSISEEPDCLFEGKLPIVGCRYGYEIVDGCATRIKKENTQTPTSKTGIFANKSVVNPSNPDNSVSATILRK